MMSEQIQQTLWALARSWPHEVTRFIHARHHWKAEAGLPEETIIIFDYRCRRCHLEKWAKEIDDVLPIGGNYRVNDFRQYVLGIPSEDSLTNAAMNMADKVAGVKPLVDPEITGWSRKVKGGL